jgi:hypothetical protein
VITSKHNSLTGGFALPSKPAFNGLNNEAATQYSALSKIAVVKATDAAAVPFSLAAAYSTILSKPNSTN